MNLAAIRTEVYDRVGIDSTDTSMPAAYITRAINSALHFIETDHDCPWLAGTTTLVTAAGTGAYAAPADWSKTKSLRIAGYVPLDRYDIEEIDERWLYTTSAGQPTEWAVWADQIELRPIPDAVYTLIHRYYKVEADLVGDSDTPAMPARFHTAIAEVATWLALRKDREDPRALGAFNAYLEWKKRLAEHENRFSGPMKVKVRADRSRR